MGNKIGWCDETRNPLRVKTWPGQVWGVKRGESFGYHCTKCSPGCKHCWAEQVNMKRGTGYPYTSKLNEQEWYLDLSVFDSLPKTKPCKVFVQDMSDMFHETVPFELIGDLYYKMIDIIIRQNHEFMLLTKRPDIMYQFYKWQSNDAWWPQHLTLGVTVCNQKEADEKIPILLQIPAAKRFICVEPMLEDIQFAGTGAFGCDCPEDEELPEGEDQRCYGTCAFYKNAVDKQRRIDRVILGCESGPKARYCDNRWMQSVVDQCVAVKVPVWVKQIQSPGGQLIRDIKLFPPGLARREDR